VIEQMSGEDLSQHLGEVVPGLLKGYDNKESSVRKAAVFCLVALYIAASGERVMPYLSSLNGSKMKLLNLYIKRAQASTANSASTSKTTSPTTSTVTDIHP
jgi:CLIP-associating protein 1/2